jgi:acylphosphatase
MQFQELSVSDKFKQIHAIAKGRVQRVGYRAFCVENATELGLIGYSQNLTNGDVLIVAEGPESVLREYVTLLRQGPRMSKVKEVEFRWEEAQQEFTGFEIKL